MSQQDSHLGNCGSSWSETDLNAERAWGRAYCEGVFASQTLSVCLQFTELFCNSVDLIQDSKLAPLERWAKSHLSRQHEHLFFG